MINPSSSIPSERTTVRTATTYPVYDRPFARISWGAVFAGAIIALATQIVLALIGMAIGLATLNPATGDSPSGTALGTGAAIWLVISSLISLFVGGYIAARLAGRFNGWLHGLVTWGTLTLLTLMLLTTAAGQLIGAASGLTNFAVSNSDKTSRLPAALQQPIEQLKNQASQSADQAAALPWVVEQVNATLDTTSTMSRPRSGPSPSASSVSRPQFGIESLGSPCFVKRNSALDISG